MKRVFLIIVVGLLGIAPVIQSQTVNLQGIQDEIEQALYTSFATGNTSLLTDVANRLKQDDSPLTTYWWAYAKYYEAIFHLKINQRDKSESTVQEGVEALLKLKTKNSEEFALLAYMQSFSMQFITNFMDLGVLSEKVGGNIENAIRLDVNNLRAYLVAASIDLRTPEQYGGGKKAEQYLLKAVSLETQTVVDAASPSWGKEQVYRMLIELYLKKGNMDLAKKYIDEAQSLFPEKDWGNYDTVSRLNLEREQHVELKESSRSLEEISIVARRPVSEEFSVQRLGKMDIYLNPTANADALKAITILPASTATDESANPSLRGSSADRTRVIVNGMPVHNPVRLSGLDNVGVFSLFNTDMIQSQYVYASNPPLSYGNVTSGIVEIETETRLAQNMVKASAGLGNAGFLLSQQIKSPDNFAQIYGNYFYGKMLTALNGKNIPRLNDYTVCDGGLNFRVKLGKQASINLYSYGIDESSDYRMNMYAYEANAVSDKQRFFNILSFRWHHGRHLISFNHGNDFSKENLQYGNMVYKPKNTMYYSSGSYKYVGDKYKIQAGASHEYARYNANNSRLPRYFYALTPESPVWICDSTLKNQSLEIYAYAKWNISPKLVITGGVRSNVPARGDNQFLSRQAGLKYSISKHSSLLLAAGKYQGHSVPNYYYMVYLPQTATQYAIDYDMKRGKTSVNAAIYFKSETGNYASNFIDHSEKRNIVGAELFASQRIYRWFTVSGSYTYLHSKQYANHDVFKAYNSLPYIFKTMVSFQKTDVGIFAFSYTSRSGLWFSPITGGAYNPPIDCYSPEYAGINTQRMTAYNRVDFTASKIFIVGKCNIVGYFAINNLLNIKNESGRIYSNDYHTSRSDYFNGRLFYFGMMISC